MEEHGTTARPYAQAVFEIAWQDHQLGAWADFLGLAAELSNAPDMRRLLATPGADVLGLAAAIGAICQQQLPAAEPLKAGARSVGVSFLKVLAENRRLGSLPDILSRFLVLKAEAERTLQVTLSAAASVSDTQQQIIIDALKKRFERQISLTIHLDATLIGGARLQVGDRIIDGSVRTGLDKLSTALRV